MPLTLLARGADTTVSNPGGVEHPQRAIVLGALLGRVQRLACWTTQCPVGLEGKVLSREAPSFPGGGGGGWVIARRGSRRVGSLLLDRRDGRSKLGRAHGGRLQLMPQFQAQVPHPLRDDLPAFLTRGRLTTPAIRVLFGILIGQSRFKGAAMQIQLDDIGDSERVWGQIGEEEFVDDA